MTTKDYDSVADGLLALARSIETSKRPGYTIGSEDVLANFKAVAERAGITTEQAWAVYFLKHIDAITSIMTRPDLPMAEAADGRFADAINYLRLGWAILQERSERGAGNTTGAQITGTGRAAREIAMQAQEISNGSAKAWLQVGEHGQWIKA